MIKGQCLCGAIGYQYDGVIEESIICYCRDCQQAQGSVMAWNSPLDKHKFKIVQGLKFLKEYFHTPLKARVFCQQCGSPIYSYRHDLPDVIRLRLGTVTEGVIPVPNQEYFLQYKATFLQIQPESLNMTD
ncbi:hypothetical protein EC844_13225 [Acinetobacter calcoaceticus]|uniref:CENP-V/GFA domain-containing protein n=1 Tax=Acinetobacter calcoaceticus TaxID=471 RepID=A0A4V2QZE3_ACICA|nr:hypothetical protein EC844_13225 [Acinetobacter calcoaceticus]